MKPGKKDLEIPQGGTFIMPVTWEETDLTGCTAVAVLTPAEEGAEPIEFSSEGDDPAITFTDAEEGELSLELTDEQTADFDWKRGVWVLEITFTDGRSYTLLRGAVTVLSRTKL